MKVSIMNWIKAFIYTAFALISFAGVVAGERHLIILTVFCTFAALVAWPEKKTI